jgi:hypothetical protein
MWLEKAVDENRSRLALELSRARAKFRATLAL